MISFLFSLLAFSSWSLTNPAPGSTVESKDYYHWMPEIYYNNPSVNYEMVGPSKFYFKCKRDGDLALTYDDGPNPETTSKLLDLLKERNIRASFFVIGKKMDRGDEYRQIVKRAHQEGHLIAGHTYNHVGVDKLADAVLVEEMTRTSDLIFDITGSRPTFFRPPFGNIGANAGAVLNYLGYRSIYWNFDTKDWEHQSTKTLHEIVTKYSEANKGYILLCHDVYNSTIDAQATMIDHFAKLGYRFVRLDDCIF